MSKGLILGVLLAVVALVFAACRAEEEVEEPDVTPTPAAEASATPQATPAPTPTLPEPIAELQRLREEEAAKPKFDGVINGIRLYPTNAPAALQRKDACTDTKPEEVEHPDIGVVAGTPMEIAPTYLPAGAEEVAPRWPPAVCNSTVAYVERRWGIPGKGELYVIRYEGERAINIDAPVERISAGTVAGRPAVLVKPLVEGYDASTVVLAEDFGITLVSAFGLSLDDTVKIAEGLE